MDSKRRDAGGLFAESVAIMERLRAPGGCPWDREQTFSSIQPYTIEETYEVLDAIDRGHWADLCEELGDLLLQVLFYAEMAADAGHFGIADVLTGLNAKLIRRHPHVFPPEQPVAGLPGTDGASDLDSAQVLRNWDAIKQQEKASRGPSHAPSNEESDNGRPASGSALDGVLRSQPALMEARKLGSRARKTGFDWPGAEGLFDKLGEETGELRAAIAKSQTEQAEGAREAAKEEITLEVGDLLFTAANLARHLEVDPELALRGSSAKFRRRFQAMERISEKKLESLSAEELDGLWNRVKAEERAASPLAP
ncbi:MAG TPA: nucleoside triphosphate pyrophosphohydrolase [Acidobacteriaceae bacterium]|jgi:MazG family protein|nr:nucleoside triphosphate pyrophosphohydrolase [Acidobacteriaceae bacterium]